MASSGYKSGKRGGQDYRFDFVIPQADLIANNALDLICPYDGWICGLTLAVNKAITTGGTVNVRTSNGNPFVAGAAAALTNTVQGGQITVASGAVKGTAYSSNPTDGDVVTTKVAKGDRIQIVTAGFASAGEIAGHLRINSSQPNAL